MDYIDNFKPAQKIEPRDDDWGIYKTLLESTNAIPWKLNWETKQFDYIGPQIEALLGWPQESWLGAMDWINRIHEEERAAIAAFCIRQSEEGIDHEADYRALKADGSFVWIRDVVHVIRDAKGKTTDLVGFMFDISERKRMEEELLSLNEKLQEISRRDGLTGIGNRFLFDQHLKSEWARAQRSQSPLSLIIFDIDFFKQYNDSYGHLQGDECLQRLTRAITGIPVRSTDLFARYGGEEFVMLLPDTPNEAAALIAERCRQAILELGIPHRGSVCAPSVTISLGVSTLVPTSEMAPEALLEHADKLLYQAKDSGRNCVCAAACPTGPAGH
ncbi:GGDEF domain-containing protein [Uliginosibacterium sp. 31-12]|uniref:GGDEF domain-containing protein n=1 Tax=Uliginosibacterium sp. 31-12 TaxID=3062781 RepID=UPI0026E387F1|nr:diguanylate cyclase [Uliginosibacterium sp. 31-12]MDO6386351.1 diguanylate cyclase [Uliginosibacterium sp. 31-12]